MQANSGNPALRRSALEADWKGDWYGTLFRRALYPVYETHLRRRRTLQFLAEYEANQWLPPERILQIQWGRLKALIEHCWNDVPYYRRRWAEAGATPDDIRSMRDFASLPVLTKREIRENYGDLQARSLRGSLLFKSTSGSTGEPLRLGYTRESFERRTAAMWRGYGWAGGLMGRRTLYLWGAPVVGTPGWRGRKEEIFNRALGRKLLNTYLMSERDMATYADHIDRYRPRVIVGYVSPLVRLAQWLLQTGRRVHVPESILGAAESLHEFQRGLLEEAFGCRAYNTYGCREFMLVASECGEQKGLHINADHLVVETTAMRPALDGVEVGEVTVTDLYNEGMPFVRYLTGDLAAPSGRRCPCGRGLPLFERVAGRTLDAIRTPEGRVVPGEFFPFVFNDEPGVRRFQVRQRSLDRIEIRVVAGEGFDQRAERRCREKLSRVFGSGVHISIDLVDGLPPDPAGKSRVTISEIA